MRVERRPCQICGTLTQSIGYKAFVCGACSIFYRRNYRNHQQLKCRQAGTCDLASGNRNTCKFLKLEIVIFRNLIVSGRACRMQMCRSLGLRMVGNSLVIQVKKF